MKESFKDYKELMESVATLSKTAKNPFFKSKYVPLKTVLEEAKRVCLKHNFIFIQSPDILLSTESVPTDILITRLIHSSGEVIEGKIMISCKDNNDPQKVGGGLTYMRRYSLTAMLGMAEQDDDGNNSSTPAKVKEPKKEVEVEEKLLTLGEIEEIEATMDKKELTEHYKKNKVSFVKRGLGAEFDKACAKQSDLITSMIIEEAKE